MVLMTSDLRAVLTAIHLARVIVRRIYLNLLWACAYNVVGIPLAAGLLMPLVHTAIPPYVAGGAMALSSVSVLASSLALKWYRPPRVSLRGWGEEEEEEEGDHRGAAAASDANKRGRGRRGRGEMWSSFASSSFDESCCSSGHGEEEEEEEDVGEGTKLLRVVVQQQGGGGGGAYGSI